MSIFGSIKRAIFGGEAESAPAAPISTPAAAATAPAPSPAPAPVPAPAPAPHATTEEINARLDAIAKEKGVQMNYRESIVDLMKLLGLDSSLANRQQLAKELGYTGDLNDSATMNIWLHKQVMESLARRGH